MELTSAWACGKALVRREFVYGHLVHPADPQLMEGGCTCPICQVIPAASRSTGFGSC